MAYAVGIDIGGTKISGALIKNKKIIKKIKIPTGKTKKDILKNLFLLISSLKNTKAKSIGIGVPGTVNNGKTIMLPNLKCLNNTNLKKIIENKYKIKTFIENDANCTAIGENLFLKQKNLVCLTLGTGIGSGIIINKKLYKGQGYASEIGHMVIDIKGPKCSCGDKGCLETFIGTKGLLRLARKKFSKINCYSLLDKAKNHNKKSISVYNEYGKYLGIGLSNIINIFNPDTIIITGGLSYAGNLILKPAIKEVKKRALKSTRKNVKIKISKLKYDAGLIGAAYLS